MCVWNRSRCRVTYSPTDPPLENLLRFLRIEDGHTAVIEVTSEPETVLYHKHIERTKYGPDYRASICTGPGCLYCPDGPPTRWQVCDIIVESIDGKPPVNPDRRKGTISALHMAPPIPVPDRLRYIEGITTVTPSGRGEWSRTGTGRETRYTFSPKLMVVEPLTLFPKSMVVRGERDSSARANPRTVEDWMRGINTQRGRFLPLSPVNGCAEAAVSHSPLTTKDLGKSPRDTGRNMP